MYFDEYPSPLGELLLTCEEESLTGIWLDRLPGEGIRKPEHPVLVKTRDWLDGYFRGEDRPWEIPLDPAGTPFQKQVWRILEQIPWGVTRTYGDIAADMARLLEKEKMSAQAVGQAVGKNPINILVPCHRVLGAGGRLTGYSGGLWRKQWLLEHEGITGGKK